MTVQKKFSLPGAFNITYISLKIGFNFFETQYFII